MRSTGKKFAVILSGCGFREGTEIHEAVLSYLALANAGKTYRSFSLEETLKASAPIARDEISLISLLNEKEYDGLWLPGGFGVAKHLTTFEKEGVHCSVHPEIKKVVEAFYQAKKPIVAICLAPIILAKIFENKSIEITFGTNKEDADLLKKLGAKPLFCKADEVAFDATHNFYTTPGYMEPPDLGGMYRAITKIAGLV